MVHDCDGTPIYAIVAQRFGSTEWMLEMAVNTGGLSDGSALAIGSVSVTITHCPWCGRDLREVE